MPEPAAVQLLTVDYVFIGILLLSSVYGLFRGLIREVLALVSWIAALWAAYVFGPQAAELIGSRIELGSLRLAVGYLAVFIAVLIVGGIAGYIIAKALSATGLAATDRILGLAFGALRGLAVGVLLVMLGQYTFIKDETWWRDSMTVQQLMPLAQKATVLLPAEWQASTGSTSPATQSGTAAPGAQPPGATPAGTGGAPAAAPQPTPEPKS